MRMVSISLALLLLSANALADPILRLKVSPAAFTRANGKIKEGAIYDSSGKVLCILKSYSGAFLYTPNDEVDQALANEREAVGAGKPYRPSVAMCGRMRKASRRLEVATNGDLLNRLLWIAGEGTCSAVAGPVVPAGGGEALFSPTVSATEISPVRFAAYYHGFVIANLSRMYPNDGTMLRKATSSGLGRDEYRSSFVSGHGSTKPFFNLLLQPSKWKEVSAEEAFRTDLPSQKIRHCLRELIPSVTPGTTDPTGGAKFWIHSSKPCAPGSFSVPLRFGGMRPWRVDRNFCARTKL